MSRVDPDVQAAERRPQTCGPASKTGIRRRERVENLRDGPACRWRLGVEHDVAKSVSQGDAVFAADETQGLDQARAGPDQKDLGLAAHRALAGIGPLRVDERE